MTHVRRLLTLGTLAVLLLGIPSAASAQEQARAGLVITSSGSLSLLWHVSDHVAVRPEIDFTRSTAENTAFSGEQTSNIFSPGVSLLFYAPAKDNLRMYVSPRYVYSRAHSESSSVAGATESTATSHSVSGSVGAQYDIHRRFGAFGEVGLAFGKAKTGNNKTTSLAVRTAVGVIWNF